MGSAHPADSPNVDQGVILRELRTARDEVQLARLIARVAQADQTFARGFVRALISLVPRPNQACRLLVEDAELRCSSERRFIEGQRERIDLRFASASPAVTLFVELKLFSDYGPEQLRRYLNGINAENGECLVSITRNVSRYREPDADEPAWLGSIRLARLAPLLEGLPGDETLRKQWNLLLKVLKEDGDLGSIKLEQDHVTAYERSDEAVHLLTTFLVEIGSDVIQKFRAQLAARTTQGRASAAFVPVRRGASRGRREPERDPDHPDVHAKDEDLWLAISVPASGPERVWIGFYVNKDDGKASFYVGAGWSEERDPSARWQECWTDAISRLREELGERLSVDGDNYCQIDQRLSDFVDREDVPLALAATAAEELSRFVQAGLFDADVTRARRTAR